MSRTPVLTKKQQKSSLSAKKTKTRETVRNALASPFLKYWPLISNEHYQILKNVLNRYLPKLLSDRVKIPWNELRKVPKSERKQFRDQYIAEHFGPGYTKANTDPRDGLILGINDVTKSLEREEAKSVLITEDILPRLMVEHVIDQAIIQGIPVLVVPELRKILKENCGIAGGAVGFTDWPNYKLVCDKIKDISKKYPIPENHINFDRAQNVADDSIIIIEDSMIEDISQAIPINTTNIYVDKPTNEIEKNFNGAQNVADDSIIIIEDSIIEEISQAIPINTTNICVDKPTHEIEKKSIEDCTVEDIEPVKNVYLLRTDKSNRAFIPKNNSEELHKDKMDVDTSGFLSFSVNSPYEQEVKKKYVSLKVLRIKGDNSRTKKKIEAIKQKKIKQKRSKRN